MGPYTLKSNLIDLVKSFDDENGLPEDAYNATHSLLFDAFGSDVTASFRANISFAEDYHNPGKSRAFFEEKEHMYEVLAAIEAAEVQE